MDRHLARPLMEQLREDTHTLHRQAERQELQTDMMRGCLPKSRFIAYLEQLYLIHDRLEYHLSMLCEQSDIIAGIIQSHHYHAPYLVQDLRYFGRHSQRIQPLGCTSACLAWLEHTARREPLALLGAHYVLEGSKNGGRFQAVKVREAYALSGHAGTAYLDPYRDQQPQFWTQYKASMNRAVLSPETQTEIIQAAKTLFQFFIDFCCELMAPEPVAYSIASPQTSDEVVLQ